MVTLKMVYILKTSKDYFVGSTFDAKKVLQAFREKDNSSEFVILCPMGVREASRAIRFLKHSMKKVDFIYWEKQGKIQQVRWIYKLGGMEPDIASDYSNEYNVLTKK